MTAHEIANILLAGPDVMVVVSGYEGGVDEVTGTKPPTPIHLGVHNAEWYYGSHEFCERPEFNSCMHVLDEDEAICTNLPMAIHIR